MIAEKSRKCYVEKGFFSRKYLRRKPYYHMFDSFQRPSLPSVLSGRVSRGLSMFPLRSLHKKGGGYRSTYATRNEHLPPGGSPQGKQLSQRAEGIPGAYYDHMHPEFMCQTQHLCTNKPAAAHAPLLCNLPILLKPLDNSPPMRYNIIKLSNTGAVRLSSVLTLAV